MTPDQVFSAALALPPDSRAALAEILRDSLMVLPTPAGGQDPDLDLDERAQLLTAHFHEAKKAALHRAQTIETAAGSAAGTACDR